MFSPYCRQVKDNAVIRCFLTADFTYYVFVHPEPVEGPLLSSQHVRATLMPSLHHSLAKLPVFWESFQASEKYLAL